MSVSRLDLSVGGNKSKVFSTPHTPSLSKGDHKTGISNTSFLNDEKTDHEILTSNGQSNAGFAAHTDTMTNLNYGTLAPTLDHKVAALDSTTTKVYFRRWPMLFLFCLYSFSNAFQWIHLNIIADIVINYYNESLPVDTFQRNTAIDWLSMVYMLAYIPLIFPATWFLDKKGLRICCILGSFLNAVGAWLKCASVSPDRFALLMFAQTICAIAQIWILGIPARLAAVWFGLNEVSTATSLGVFGNQVGVAVGFLLPPIIVPKSNDTDVIGKGLNVMSYGTAAFTTVIFILVLIFFQDKPPKPPSRAQEHALKAATTENYRKSLVRLFSNIGFILLTIAYGINTGSYYAISTLLSVIILRYFPDEGENAGLIGLVLVLTGIVGSVLAGLWLDKTKTFKGTTVVIYILSFAGIIAFAFTLDQQRIWLVFVTSGFFGFFMTGYLPVGFEFAAELTFPESEGTSSGLLNASATLFGIIFTLSMRAMIDSVSVLSANIIICSSLLVGGIITAMIKPDYRRQEAGKAIFQDITNKEFEITTDVTKDAEQFPKGKI